MTSAFERSVRELAAQIGVDPAGAVVGEHARWELYQHALAHRRLDAITLAALRDDPDSALVSATVVRALDLVAADERMAWFERLPAGTSRDFAERRAADLDRLKQLVTDVDVEADQAEVGSWSLWLQIRAADGAVGPSVVRALITGGGTKRIRHRARERLRSLATTAGPAGT